MKQIKQRQCLFLFLLLAASLYPLLSFGQTEKECFLDKWAIGAGYDFLHDDDYPFNKNTFEVSIKYLHTPKHSFYLTVPFYFKNDKVENKLLESGDHKIPLVYRICGIGLGYNYTVFDWKGLSGFCGIGFDFKRGYRQIMYYLYDSDEIGSKPTDYRIQDYQNNVYGLTPQVGLSYKFGHLGCDLKYTFSAMLDMYKYDIIFSNGDKYNADLHPEWDVFVKSYRSLHGLSLSLFYYF